MDRSRSTKAPARDRWGHARGAPTDVRRALVYETQCIGSDAFVDRWRPGLSCLGSARRHLPSGSDRSARHHASPAHDGRASHPLCPAPRSHRDPDGHANVTGLRLLASIVNHGFRGSDHVLHPPPSTLASAVVGTKGDELICAYIPGADRSPLHTAPMIGPRPYEDARRG